MKRTGLGGILALLLCLGLGSLEARGDDLERFLAQMQREAASKPVARRPVKPSTGEKALCVASCGGGTTVSVDNCSSCVAVDQDCSRKERGYAQCSGGSRVDCPSTCPTTHTYTAECQFGESVSVTCEGSGTQVNHNCPYERGYVQCSGGEKVDCPPCGVCHASVSCPDDGWVECEGYEYCESRQDVCWVLCDGVYDSCSICW